MMYIKRKILEALETKVAEIFEEEYLDEIIDSTDFDDLIDSIARTKIEESDYESLAVEAMRGLVMEIAEDMDTDEVITKAIEEVM